MAERHSGFQDGLGEELLARFDSTDNRQNYLAMQEELCDLQLSDRHLIGYQVGKVIKRICDSNRSEDMCYAGIWADAKPDFAYVLVSRKGKPRPELIQRCSALLLGSISFYGKDRGMAIADRDGESYEVQLVIQFQSTPEAKQMGELFFKNRKVDD